MPLGVKHKKSPEDYYEIARMVVWHTPHQSRKGHPPFFTQIINSNSDSLESSLLQEMKGWTWIQVHNYFRSIGKLAIAANVFNMKISGSQVCGMRGEDLMFEGAGFDEFEANEWDRMMGR